MNHSLSHARQRRRQPPPPTRDGPCGLAAITKPHPHHSLSPGIGPFTAESWQLGIAGCGAETLRPNLGVRAVYRLVGAGGVVAARPARTPTWKPRQRVAATSSTVPAAAAFRPEPHAFLPHASIHRLPVAGSSPTPHHHHSSSSIRSENQQLTPNSLLPKQEQPCNGTATHRNPPRCPRPAFVGYALGAVRRVFGC